MDISSLPELDPESSLYSERCATFEAYANQKEKILEWISERFDEEITSQLVNTETEDRKVALSVLGIGSGDGRIELKMLKKLMQRFRLIECTVLEPSAERITSYKKLVEEQKDALTSVTFDWRQELIQDFCKANAGGSKKFHFVNAIHSCYFIPKHDLDFFLKVICGWTEGKILIMQSAGTSIFLGLQNKFPKTMTLHPNQKFIHGNQILDSLKALGMHLQTSVLPSECDITSCFENDSTDGKRLLDFFLNVVGCEDNGPPNLLKMIREFLKSEGVSYTRNGRLYAPVPTQVVIASTSKMIPNINK